MFDLLPIGENPIKEKKLSLEDIEKYRVRHTDEVPKPDVVLSIGGQIVSTRKNIFGISGKAKVGKSFLMTLINSIVLKKGEMGVLESYLPKGKDKILYFDTEQSLYHVSLMLNRVKKIVEERKMDNLLMYAFDSLRTDDRYEYVKFLINNIEGVGLVIIDGVADLVKSVNDEVMAVDLADTLRRLATERDVAIGYVLHQNPSDNVKMRGHLGTVLMNKSETVIQISTSKEDESVKLVDTLQTRNKKPENWSFEIIDGQPVIMDEVFEEKPKGRIKVKQLTDDERKNILAVIYSDVRKDLGLGYTVLVEKVREVHGNLGVTSAKEMVKYCKEMGWIANDGSRSNYFLI